MGGNDTTAAANSSEPWDDMDLHVSQRLIDLAERLPERQGDLVELASVLIDGFANEVEGVLGGGPLSPQAQNLLDVAVSGGSGDPIRLHDCGRFHRPSEPCNKGEP